MTALIFTAALVLSGVDSLSTTRVASLELKAPANWAVSEATDGRSWDAPGNEGGLELSVWPVYPVQMAQQCIDGLLEKVMASMGKDGWEKLSIGGQPALRKVLTDFVGGPDAGKTEANKVTTVTYVGCNGATKWSLSMSSNTSRSIRFGAVLKAIVASIAYGK